jgi:predicted AlkP superfamily pyrophosphatase or phosphodiesterase
LYPIATYISSTQDKNIFESQIPGESGDSFPHITSTIKTDKYNSFRFTPSANTYTFDMSKAAIEAEQLGKSDETDFLAISLSSTDYIGHVFGPNSIEIEDTYLRLDKDLADFLVYLDQKIGKGKYLIFLSADHGAAHVPAFARENKMPGGALDDNSLRSVLNRAVDSVYGVKNSILSVINYQVYTDAKAIRDARGDADKIKNFIIQQLLSYPAIANAFYVNKLTEVALPQSMKNMLINGHNQILSGDVQFIFKPQWFDGGDLGTTHGAWNPYDSHIPLLWYGWNVSPGKTNRETYMTDIAPTLAAMLHIQLPTGSIGKVIEEVAK